MSRMPAMTKKILLLNLIVLFIYLPAICGYAAKRTEIFDNVGISIKGYHAGDYLMNEILYIPSFHYTTDYFSIKTGFGVSTGTEESGTYAAFCFSGDYRPYKYKDCFVCIGGTSTIYHESLNKKDTTFWGLGIFGGIETFLNKEISISGEIYPFSLRFGGDLTRIGFFSGVALGLSFHFPI